MNRKRIVWFLIFLLVSPLFSFSQENLTNYVSQSTNGDYRYNNTYAFKSPIENISSVDLFRGKINVAIPIYTIKVSGFDFPISLRYNSNGIKVNQHASWVGLGWDLNVPGVITRTVQGVPDESSYVGFLDHGGDDLYKLLENELFDEPIYDYHFADPNFWGDQSVPGGTNGGAHVFGIGENEYEDEYLDLRHIAENYFDGMPDIFNYNTGRNSGKFVFDRNMNVQEIPKSNNQIFFHIPSNNESGDWSNTSFRIIDENGIEYIYDILDIKEPNPKWSIKSQSEYKSNFIASRQDALHDYNLNDSYVSAWHLSKIILPDNKEIHLIYECDNLYYVSAINESYFNSLGLYDGSQSDENDPDIYVKVNRYYAELTETKHRLIKISWNNNEIEFNKSTSRRIDMSDITEHNGFMLDNIAVINNQNSLVKKVNFNYSYWGTPNTYWGTASYKRLKLESITEIGNEGNQLPPYVFTYYEEDESGDPIHLPSYFSHHRDLWGYYKELPNTLRISKPKYHLYPDDANNPLFNSVYSIYERTNYQGNHYVSDGYDLIPDLSGTRTYMLKSIANPTGGSVNIEYELNTFRYDGQDVKGPGVRVKRIVSNIPVGDSYSNTSIKEYFYTNADTSTGLVAELPIICRFDEGSYKSPPLAHNSPIDKRFQWATSVFSEVRNQQDTEVGYTMVTKESINNQTPTDNYKTIYSFDFSGGYYKYQDVFHSEMEDYIYKKPSSTIFINNGLSGYLTLWNAYDYLEDNMIRDKNPSLLNPDFDWYRGSLLKEEHYNSDGLILKKIEYEYDLGPVVDQVYGIVAYDYYSYSIPEGTILAVIGNPFGNHYIYSPGLELRKIRFGSQCYTSAFKSLKSKSITTYVSGNELTDQYFYIYADNGYLNKRKIKKEQQILSNGDIKQTVHKYTYEYATNEESCFINYEDNRAIEKQEYFNTLEGQCFTTEVCYDYDNFGSQDCLNCINAAFETYLNSLSDYYNSYEDCCDNMRSNDPYASAVLQLFAKNQLNIVEKQEQYIRNNTTKQTFGDLTLYKEGQNGVVKPAKSLKVRFSEPQQPINTNINTQNNFIYSGYSPVNNFDIYDISGNLVQEHKEDDIFITYLYGYNYSYPVAKIVNSSYSLVSEQLGLLGVSYEQLQEMSNADLRILFANLRNNLPNAFITSYTFLPLIGINSETDPSGRTTFFEYDSFNRVKTIKNNEEDIIKHYEYHYFQD